MKLTITITSPGGVGQDIQVDETQRIKTTLRVLGENLADWGEWQEAGEIRIKSSGRRVDKESTYQEANIYTGMELLVMGGDSMERKVEKTLQHLERQYPKERVESIRREGSARLLEDLCSDAPTEGSFGSDPIEGKQGEQRNGGGCHEQ